MYVRKSLIKKSSEIFQLFHNRFQLGLLSLTLARSGHTWLLLVFQWLDFYCVKCMCEPGIELPCSMLLISSNQASQTASLFCSSWWFSVFVTIDWNQTWPGPTSGYFPPRTWTSGRPRGCRRRKDRPRAPRWSIRSRRGWWWWRVRPWWYTRQGCSPRVRNRTGTRPCGSLGQTLRSWGWSEDCRCSENLDERRPWLYPLDHWTGCISSMIGSLDLSHHQQHYEL